MKESSTISAERQDNENYSKHFTRIPNILFVSYKHLTKEEKFLYCQLRCVYWDAKPRFVSLRELSDLVGYSLAALSKMLPRLHACGLIHAEILQERSRDGKNKGHAKYHITIPDIWEENRRFFEDRSPNERSGSHIVHQTNDIVHQTNDIVHQTNRSVHQTNNTVLFREQSDAQVERAKDSNKDISKDTLKERKYDAGRPKATDPQPSFSHSSLPQSSSQKSSFSSEAKAEEVTLSPEEQVVYDLGAQTLFPVKRPKITPTVQGYCATLAKAGITTLDKMQDLIAFTKKETHFSTIHLGNLVNALNGWLQTQTHRTATADRSRSSGSTQPVASARVSSEANQRNLERLRQRAQAALAAEQVQKGTPSCTR